MDPANETAVAGEAGRCRAPLARAALLVSMRRSELHRPEWPRRRACAGFRRTRHQLVLRHARRALSKGRSGAIGGGIASTDDQDALAARRDLRLCRDALAGRATV